MVSIKNECDDVDAAGRKADLRMGAIMYVDAPTPVET